MKRAFKYAAAAALLSMTLVLGACGGGKTDKSLYEHGLDVVSMMGEMVGSSQYFELLSGNAGLRELLSSVGSGDFSEPKAVYKITLSGDGGAILEMAETDGLSDALKENVKSRLLSSVVTRINAMSGSEGLAAASVCSAGKLFVSDELTENQIYIYIYENAAPAAVTFTMGENGAVSASGMFILYGDFTPDMMVLMDELGLKTEEITEQCIPRDKE